MKNNEVVSPPVAILIVALTFLVFLLVGGVLFIKLGFLFASIIGELLIIVLPLAYMLHRRVNISEYIGLQVTPKTILLGLLVGFLLLTFDITVTIGMTAIFGPSALVEESNKTIMELSRPLQGCFQLIVALSLAGFCEEFTFRGFLQNSIRTEHSLAAALLISSLAFGLFHFDLQVVYTLSAFLMGLVLGFVYNHWRSYTVSSVAHATVNLSALALLLLST